MKNNMNKKDWIYVLIAMVIVSAIVSIVFIKMASSDLSLSPPTLAGTSVYTKAEVDKILSQVPTTSEVGTSALNMLRSCEEGYLLLVERTSSGVSTHSNFDDVTRVNDLCRIFTQKSPLWFYEKGSARNTNNVTSYSNEIIGFDEFQRTLSRYGTIKNYTIAIRNAMLNKTGDYSYVDRYSVYAMCCSP